MGEDLTIEPLRSIHTLEWFDCGDEKFDKWLNNQALTDHKLGRSKTFVWVAKDLVVGYFTLVQTQVSESAGVSRGGKRILPKGYPRSEPAPGVLLAKFAIDKTLQGKGKGYDLLAEALLSAGEAALLIGGVFFLVDPAEGKDWLRDFYGDAGFQQVPGAERMYMLLSHD